MDNNQPSTPTKQQHPRRTLRHSHQAASISDQLGSSRVIIAFLHIFQLCMARSQHADLQVPNLMSLTYQAPIPEATDVPRCWKVVMRCDPLKNSQNSPKTQKSSLLFQSLTSACRHLRPTPARRVAASAALSPKPPNLPRTCCQGKIAPARIFK